VQTLDEKVFAPKPIQVVFNIQIPSLFFNNIPQTIFWKKNHILLQL
jgi:hypothetical protein